MEQGAMGLRNFHQTLFCHLFQAFCLVLSIKSEECEDFDDGTTNLMRVSSRETCLLLLKHGADVNAKNDQGKTALMIAAKHSNTGLVEALLQRNADAKLLDNQNKTALDIAKDNNNKVIISLLSSADG
jgi:ankyrin repeat protein